MLARMYGEAVSEGDLVPNRVLTPTTVLLFRFSAATGNPHRIHFDTAYAQSEGYPDVLVQSHLHAALLVEALSEWLPHARLTKFRWENRSIAVPGDVITVQGVVTKVTAIENGVCANIELESRSDRDVLLAPGWATVEFTSDHSATFGGQR